MQVLRISSLTFLAVFLTPLAVHAAWWLSTDAAKAWNEADWSSARVLPTAHAKPEAMVHVYAARTGRWKGIFAHHSWIVVKEKGAGAYTRFDKVAWGQPVKTNNWAPDARWYGHAPTLVGAVEGPAAEALIPKIRAAVARYPYSLAACSASRLAGSRVVEVNVLGLVAGIDIRRPAIKLPGLGRIGIRTVS